jgi:hypothetical protein
MNQFQQSIYIYRNLQQSSGMTKGQIVIYALVALWRYTGRAAQPIENFSTRIVGGCRRALSVKAGMYIYTAGCPLF